MNIIFLDVDGVLNSMSYFEENKGTDNDISDFHVAMLSKIYHTCDAKIVLSSTWRELKDETDEIGSKMYQLLIDSLKRYDMEIMDIVPIINNNRPYEITEWLKQHKDEKINFVSLDDDFSLEEYEKYQIGDCLVKTKFFCNSVEEGGLQQEHVDKAIKILRGEK